MFILGYLGEIFPEEMYCGKYGEPVGNILGTFFSVSVNKVRVL